MDKYYTPKIEEFHFGFEYEYLTNGDEWIRHSIFDASDYMECKEDLDNDKIRVKYLDRESIEELGWVYTENFCYYELGEYKLDGQIERQDIVIEQYKEDYTMGEHYSWHDTKFYGKIKNKSELKVIMKQLGII